MRRNRIYLRSGGTFSPRLSSRAASICSCVLTSGSESLIFSFLFGRGLIYSSQFEFDQLCWRSQEVEMLTVRLLCFFLNIFHCHLKLKFKVQNHLLKKRIEFFTIKYGNIMVQFLTKNYAMHALKTFFLIVMGSNFNNSPNITLDMC